MQTLQRKQQTSSVYKYTYTCIKIFTMIHDDEFWIIYFKTIIKYRVHTSSVIGC